MTRPFDFRSVASTYRALGPALQREIVVGFDSLDCRGKIRKTAEVDKDWSSHTGDVLVTAQGCDNDSTIGKLLAVLGGGREETLK